MTLRCKTSWLFPLRHLCQWRGLGQLPWYLEKLIFSLQTAKNQVGTYSERCPPFRSFRHLQSVHHLMCPPRDRWFLNHVIMSHHVSSCHLEYLEPIRCKRLCWSACRKNAQRLKKVFTDSRWFQSLLMIGVHVKKRMFQASTAFLAAGQLFFEDHVYCLLLCTSTVYTVYRYIQIHPDTWYRYRSMSQYVDLWAKCGQRCEQSEWTKNERQSIPLCLWKNDSHHLTSPRLWHLLDPRPSVADSGGALPAHRQRHVVRTFSGNATMSAASISKRRLRFNHLGRSKVGSEFSFGRSLGSILEKWFLFFLSEFFVLSNFLCRFSGGLDNGKSLSYLRGHGWQPASSEKYPSFCNENLYENHTFESQNSKISSKYFQLFKCQIYFPTFSLLMECWKTPMGFGLWRFGLCSGTVEFHSHRTGLSHWLGVLVFGADSDWANQTLCCFRLFFGARRS